MQRYAVRSIAVLSGDYTLEAWSGDWTSAPRYVKIGERAIQDCGLEPSQRGGTIAGPMILQNATRAHDLCAGDVDRASGLRGQSALTYTDDQVILRAHWSEAIGYVRSGQCLWQWETQLKACV